MITSVRVIMRHIKDILKEMGFSPQSSPSTQAAFVKYLIKQGYGVDVDIPAEYLDIKPSQKKDLSEGDQMSFPGFEKPKVG